MQQSYFSLQPFNIGSIYLNVMRGSLSIKILSLIILAILIGVRRVECSDVDHNQTTTDKPEDETTLPDPDVEDPDGDDESSSNLNADCECGVRKPEPGKIVGGTLAAENTWPWMAALIYTGNGKPKQFCGSTLINDRYLLTAAHCVRDIPQRGHDKFKAFLGGNVIPDEDTNFLSLSTIRMHPRFNPGTLDNDLALIRLTTPVKFSNSIKPICLSQAGSPFIGRKATVIGWGWTHDDTEADNLLREVEVEVIRNSKCQENYDKIGIKITQSMMCAALPGKDSCKGDSGGPISVVSDSRSGRFNSDTESGRHNLVGVVSFGQRCASPSYPGIYTRVQRMMSWIKANTKDSVKCAS